MFEKVSRSLKYDSNFFFDHRHIYIYMDTTVDHFTPLALRVRGNKQIKTTTTKQKDSSIILLAMDILNVEGGKGCHLSTIIFAMEVGDFCSSACYQIMLISIYVGHYIECANGQ